MESRLPLPNTAPLPRLLVSPEEGAEVIGVSRSRMYGLLASGEIPSLKIGKNRRIPLAEIELWIERTLEASRQPSDVA